MTTPTDGHDAAGTGAHAVSALLAEPRIAAALAARAPALLVDAAGRLLAGNAAGRALIGEASMALARDLAGLAARSAARGHGGHRLEKLRLPARLTPVTVACTLVAAAGHRAVLLVALDAPASFSARRPDAAMPAFAPEPAAPPEPVAPAAAASPPPATVPLPPASPPAKRFTWRTRADGRLDPVDARLGALLGRPVQDIAGRSWAELGAVQAHQAAMAGVSFTHLPVELTAAAGVTLHAELGGAPLREGGMRGFGVVKGRPSAPLPPQEAAAAPVAAEPVPAVPTAATEDVPPADPAGAPAAPPPVEATPAATPPAAEPPRPASPAVAPASEAPRPTLSLVPPIPNVVPLRAGEGNRADTARGDAARASWEGLSTGERNAFREIARALGARIEGMDVDPVDVQADLPTDLPADHTADLPVDLPPASAGLSPEAPSTPADAELPSPRAATPSPAPELRAPEPPPPAPLPVVPAPESSAPSRAATEDPARRDGLRRSLSEAERPVLDRLPVGLVAWRGDRLLYANRTLLDWTGYADTGAMQAGGGLAGLFGGPAATEGQDGAALSILTRTGVPIAVEARLMSAPWDDAPAMLYLLRRLGEPADERQRQAELALRQSESTARELRAILDTATDGVVLIDAAGVILSMNRPAEALFGFDSAEVQGETFTLLFAPESQRAAVDYLDGLASNGVASVLNDGREVIGRVREGGLIPLFMTVGRVGEDSTKFCAVLRDITQWKRAEEELTEAKRLAERANMAKSDFLAKISHEIRTPLNAIIGFSEVMMEERFGPVENQRYRDYLRDIHASGGHLISLINDLLDLSKIEAGKLDLSFTSVALNEIVQQGMAIMQPQANRERIIIRSSLAADLPPVVADARSIRQIILNLVSNSVKFTRPGGQVILSTALTSAGEVVLRVRDTGIGMSEADIAIAMEPFRQIATSGQSGSGGTGLGLPLTKALAEANRASFTIRSAVESGTLVEITFPSTRVLAE
ncbi:PAS domain S-box-containing protein [Ancylobacter sp. 3268]|uniref:PAS domain-containing sensor histidine kinase n=1 Tax=Ancylobacter sp. 3268 TaxID=2817752 RepID=UPI002862CD36|nr:PAS domain-containing sensor histidine kinase [Ancylobacter sp. 3268]MDR6952795.1 PAS domain S-box-containing protein [Ancylobacter sp. 3268]